MKLFAVATLLDTDNKPFGRAWKEVDRLCEISGFRASRLPHVSWHVAEGYAMEQTSKMLERIAKNQKNITTHTVGLGIFPQENPVLYLPVCKTPDILNLHHSIWFELDGVSQASSSLYSPEHWVPHITLLSGITDKAIVHKAAEVFSGRTFDFEFVLSNFAVIYKDESQSGITSRFDFGGL